MKVVVFLFSLLKDSFMRPGTRMQNVTINGKTIPVRVLQIIPSGSGDLQNTSVGSGFNLQSRKSFKIKTFKTITV